MKIVDIQISHDTIDLTRPYAVAFSTMSDVKIVTVKITTETGIIGYGTGSPVEIITGETLDMALTALQESTLKALTNQEFATPQEALAAVADQIAVAPSASSALDSALFDAFAKEAGKPLADYLGRHHTALPTSITIGIKDTIDEMLTEAQEYIDRGFRVIKLKLGKDLGMDIEFTRALKAAVPENTVLYVDPNQGYTVDDYREFLKATADLNIAFIEQPVKAEDTESLFTLSPEEKKFVCVDESLKSIKDAQAWEERGEFPAQVFNIKFMKCGGIAQATEIAKVAQRHNIDLMLGCMDESCASIAAALHFAYAQPNTKYIDLDGSFDLERDVFAGGFELKDGYMHILDKPGLGVEPV